MLDSITKRDGETTQEFMVRVFLAKENGELDVLWRDIADVFGCSEDYARRIAKGVKLYHDTIKPTTVCESRPVKVIREPSNEYLEMLKVKVQARDERIVIGRDVRSAARYDSMFDILGDEIRKQGENIYPILPDASIEAPFVDKRAVIIALADFHIGTEFYSISGNYNTEIARVRLSEYLVHIKEIIDTHGANTAHLVLLGDMISGNIHRSIAVTNREDVISQIMIVSEMVAEFAYRVSKMVDHVEINCVTGNHSRMNKKDDAIKAERMDRLIPWYASSKLSHIKSIVVNEAVDPTLDKFTVLGHSFVAVHGDYDPFTEAGVQNVIRVTREHPLGIFFGHKHYPAFMDCSGVKAFQCGCLSGTGDDYSLEKRFNSEPNQSVVVVGEEGIVCMYPVELGRSIEEEVMLGGKN